MSQIWMYVIIIFITDFHCKSLNVAHPRAGRDFVFLLLQANTVSQQESWEVSHPLPGHVGNVDELAHYRRSVKIWNAHGT